MESLYFPIIDIRILTAQTLYSAAKEQDWLDSEIPIIAPTSVTGTQVESIHLPVIKVLAGFRYMGSLLNMTSTGRACLRIEGAEDADLIAAAVSSLVLRNEGSLNSLQVARVIGALTDFRKGRTYSQMMHTREEENFLAGQGSWAYNLVNPNESSNLEFLGIDPALRGITAPNIGLIAVDLLWNKAMSQATRF